MLTRLAIESVAPVERASVNAAGAICNSRIVTNV
jgi:hypothetical protein